jgi:hypothetical protein
MVLVPVKVPSVVYISPPPVVPVTTLPIESKPKLNTDEPDPILPIFKLGT